MTETYLEHKFISPWWKKKKKNVLFFLLPFFHCSFFLLFGQQCGIIIFPPISRSGELFFMEATVFPKSIKELAVNRPFPEKLFRFVSLLCPTLYFPAHLYYRRLRLASSNTEPLQNGGHFFAFVRSVRRQKF